MKNLLQSAAAITLVAALALLGLTGQANPAAARGTTTITIPELNIKITVPPELSDLTWAPTEFGTVSFSTERLEALSPLCTPPENRPLGSARVSGVHYTNTEERLATLGNGYLWYAGPHSPCLYPESHDVEEQLLSLIRPALQTAVLAGPDTTLPMSGFSGYACVGCDNGPSTVVTAWIGDIQCAESYPGWRYFVDVPSDAEVPGCGTEGAFVSFKVGGVPAAQTGVWHAGGEVSLDLTALQPQTLPDTGGLPGEVPAVRDDAAWLFVAGALTASFGIASVALAARRKQRPSVT